MNDIVRALEPLADLCATLGLRLQVGGSVATSVYGVARTTLDVDVIIDLPVTMVSRFVAGLESDYMVEIGAVTQAVKNRASFNIIHQDTVIKIDVFVPSREGFARESFRRGLVDSLEDDESAREFTIATPEDMILHKLVWYQLGGGVAQRQRDDVTGVIAVGYDTLDWNYLNSWAETLGVSELLDEIKASAR